MLGVHGRAEEAEEFAACPTSSFCSSHWIFIEPIKAVCMGLCRLKKTVKSGVRAGIFYNRLVSMLAHPMQGEIGAAITGSEGAGSCMALKKPWDSISCGVMSDLLSAPLSYAADYRDNFHGSF